MDVRNPIRGYLWASASILCWGAMFPIGRVLMTDGIVAPSMLAMLRYLIAAPVLFAVGFATQGRAAMVPTRKSDWLAIAGLGLVGSALMAFLLFVAQKTVSSVGASLLEAYVPIQVLLIGILAGHGTTLRQVFGIVLGFIGSMMVLKALDFGGLQLGGLSMGDLWIFLSGLCWALYTAWGRPVANRMGGIAFTSWTVLFGGLWLLLYNIATRTFALPDSAAGWGGVLFLAFFPTAIAFFGWNAAQRHISLARLSFMEYFTPLVAAACGMLIGEMPTPCQWLGAVVVIVSAFFQS